MFCCRMDHDEERTLSGNVEATSEYSNQEVKAWTKTALEMDNDSKHTARLVTK